MKSIDKSNIKDQSTEWLKKYLRFTRHFKRHYAVDFEGLDQLAQSELTKRCKLSKLPPS